MENLIFLLTASLVLYKSSKKQRRIFIGDTSCSVLFFPEASFDFTQTEEGDGLFFAEHIDKKVGYGVLCARLHSPLPLGEAQDIMASYLNRLHKPFHALYNTGIDLHPGWAQGDTSIKMVDYWQDADSFDWKVKGYTDGKTIAVLYVKNISELEVDRQDHFLDSFSFGSR